MRMRAINKIKLTVSKILLQDKRKVVLSKSFNHNTFQEKQIITKLHVHQSSSVRNEHKSIPSKLRTLKRKKCELKHQTTYV